LTQATTQTLNASLLGELYSRIVSAKPFIKWAGGKFLFLTRYGNLFPPFEGRYFEPFLGSAATFFHIQRRLGRPVEAVLSDQNAQLIRIFKAVKDDPESVSESLESNQAAFCLSEDKSSFFYGVRDRYNASLPAPSAADFIFLNRTCWNGLYRVNRQGKFNVPYGAPKNDRVVPTSLELSNASAALVRARLRATSWENAISQVRPGDFVFLDPPYYSDLLKDRGTKYRIQQFDLGEHERLARRLEDLAHRGIDFLLTNSGEREMLDLYASHGLTVNVFHMPRNISSKTDERAIPVPELLVSPPQDGKTPARIHLQFSLAAAFQRLA
jgi:DNA adenine methylase